MCRDCQERFDKNPLRVLDCKEPRCKAIVADAPGMLDMLCEECAEHFAGLKRLLEAAGVRYEVDPRIVRGLDYYTKTVFEIIMHGEREGLALCGGGRYDGLVEQIGGPSLSGVGFGIGIERIIIELEKKGALPEEPALCEVYVANIDRDAFEQAFTLCQRLRGAGVKAESDHTGRSLKAQFKYANKLAALSVLMVGGDELSRGMVKWRDMASGEEEELPVGGAVESLSARYLKKRERV